MSEALNPRLILQKINQIERELEDLRVMLLKMVAESLPEEEIDEETLREFERDLKDMIDGKGDVISGDEFIKLLSKEIED